MDLIVGLHPGCHAVSLLSTTDMEAEIERLGQTLQAAFWVENWRNSDKAKAFQSVIQDLHDLMERRVISFWVYDFLPTELQTATCVKRETSSVKAHQYHSTEL